MNGFVLFVWFIISGLIISGESCLKGFMDYDLLVEKAEQIGGDGTGDLDGNRLGFNRHSIMASLEFTCSGTITGFLLGLDVRTETNSRVEYPTIWLWNKTNETTYTRVVGSSVEIILGPSNFSSDGVYRFSLSTPLQFTANQVLGIYQPDNGDNVVRLYYQNYNGQNIYETDGDVNMYSLSNLIRMNRRPLVYPQTDSPQCISGFISSDEIKIQAREITRVSGYSNILRYFPDIGFTCNGNITHIIIGAEDQNGTRFPQICFWRLSDGGEYEQTGSFYSLVYNDANDPSTSNLRWYNLSKPIQVQNGDTLGIFQPSEMDSDLRLHFQINNGPPNYSVNGKLNNQNRYPLVSVVIETIANTMNFMYETTSSIKMSDSKTTGSPLITSSGNTTGSPMGSTFDEFPVQLEVIVGVGTGLLLLSIIIFIIIMIIILIVKHRKRTTHINISEKEDEEVIIEDNPAYQLHTVSIESVNTEDNPSYNIHTVSDEHVITENNPSYNIFKVSDEHVITENNPSYNIFKVSDEHMLINDYDVIHTVSDEHTLINDYDVIHTVSDEHVITEDNPSYNINTVSGDHLATDDDNIYSYVYSLDEPVVENDCI